MEQIRETAPFQIGPWGVFPLLNRMAGAGGTVQLEPKVMQVLVCLAEHAGEVVTREDLFATVWAGTIVHDDVLSRSVSELRKAFGDDPACPRFIETIRKTGYRLLVPVAPLAPTEDVAAAPESSTPGDPLAAARPRRVPRVLVGAVALLGVVLGAGFVRFFWPAESTSLQPYPSRPLTALPGHETDPAFAPGGDRVAFVWEGEAGGNVDVYVKTLGSETLRRLTDHPVPDRAPAWSPDGRALAFVRRLETGCAVYVMPADGGMEQKLADCDGVTRLSWSPDGRWLAYASHAPAQGPSTLTLLSVETLEQHRPVPPPPSGGDYVPVFSPDGRSLAFVRVDDRGTWQLLRLSLPEHTVHPVAEHVGKTFALAWTPDGKELVYAARTEDGLGLWRVPATGGRPAWMPLGSDDVVGVAVASDAPRLAYVKAAEDGNVWRLPLAPDAPPPQAPLIASTRWDAKGRYAPNGQHILYQSTRTGYHEIWMSDADGANAVPLTNLQDNATRDPAWSPDSRHVLFASSHEGQSELYLLHLPTRQFRRLTTSDATELGGQWSPDDRWVYFLSDRGGAWNVWKIPRQGGDAVRVTTVPGAVAFAVPQPGLVYVAYADRPGLRRLSEEDGTETEVGVALSAQDQRNWTVTKEGVYFVSREDGPPHLAFLDAATATVQRLGALGSISPFSGLSVSPDRRYVLYARTDHSESDLMLVEPFR